MATVKKSMARTRPVAPARKGVVSKMMKAAAIAPSKMGGMMKSGGKMKKAQVGATVGESSMESKKAKAKTFVKKNANSDDVMGKSLDITVPFSSKYKPATAAEKAKAIKQNAEIQKKSAKGLPYKTGGVVKKAKSGGSFPDLNKDGKITKADILKGRGVIAKYGTKMKMGGAMAKQAAIAIAMKKAGKTPKKK